MTLTIKLEMPDDLEQKLRNASSNIEADMKEAYALELYRQKQIDLFDLSRLLGLDRYDTMAFLQRHKVYEGCLTMEDLEADANTLKSLFSKNR